MRLGLWWVRSGLARSRSPRLSAISSISSRIHQGSLRSMLHGSRRRWAGPSQRGAGALCPELSGAILVPWPSALPRLWPPSLISSVGSGRSVGAKKRLSRTSVCGTGRMNVPLRADAGATSSLDERGRHPAAGAELVHQPFRNTNSSVTSAPESSRNWNSNCSKVSVNESARSENPQRSTVRRAAAAVRSDPHRARPQLRRRPRWTPTRTRSDVRPWLC